MVESHHGGYKWHNQKMPYHDALNYLVQKTSVIELYDQFGGRIAVCPEWNGRVMTSTCDGLKGDSFGCIKVQAIDAELFENFGGEDHWTLSPTIHSFTIETLKEQKVILQRTLRMTDANGVSGEFHLSRSVFLLNRRNIRDLFGDAVADSLEREDVSAVSFRTENTARSQKQAWVASRLRGMFNASPTTAILLTTPPENFETGRSSVIVDYLGGSPHSRIRYLPQTMLMRADGQKQCQVTLPFPDAPPIIGAIELRLGALTLWTFDLPNVSEDDVVRIYNANRPPTEGLDWATYYEINCFSAAQRLFSENSLTYCQSILHLNANNAVLDDLVRQIFDVSLEDISQKMLP